MRLRAAGDIGWWTFVVAALSIPSGWSGFGGMPRRYADYGWAYQSSLTLTYNPSTGFWDGIGMGPVGQDDVFTAMNVLSSIALAGLLVAVGCAVVAAVQARRWPAGLVPIIGTLIACVPIVFIAHTQTAGLWIGLNPLITFAFALAGIALRAAAHRSRLGQFEVQARRFADPKLPRVCDTVGTAN